jgi:hypothetical protein
MDRAPFQPAEVAGSMADGTHYSTSRKKILGNVKLRSPWILRSARLLVSPPADDGSRQENSGGHGARRWNGRMAQDVNHDEAAVPQQPEESYKQTENRDPLLGTGATAEHIAVILCNFDAFSQPLVEDCFCRHSHLRRARK